MQHPVNYAGVMATLKGKPLPQVVEGLVDALPQLWCDAYEAMPGSGSDIVAVDQGGFTYLFDLVAERVVVAYGLSAPNPAKRDSSRMQGFLGKISDRFKGRGDKGHIMSHRQGGGMDINLFPQRADVNRGRSAAGKIYRELERCCSTNPGSLCFSRLIYTTPDWVPDEIEYGVLYNPQQFRIERFTNAATV
jgi:hypothetical protein